MKHASASSKVATKKDLNSLEVRMNFKTDLKFEKYIHDIEEMFIGFKGGIFSKIDSFLGEVENNRLEIQSNRNQLATLATIEKRIKKIERLQAA